MAYVTPSFFKDPEVEEMKREAEELQNAENNRPPEKGIFKSDEKLYYTPILDTVLPFIEFLWLLFIIINSV